MLNLNNLLSYYNSVEQYRKLETNDKIQYDLIVPDFEKDEIDIAISNSVLQIRASKKEKKQEFIVDTIPSEISMNISIPSYVDQDNIKASLKNGILSVTINKVKKKKSIIKIT